MGKHVLIIGGGIAGLAAGCYARMNGFKAKGKTQGSFGIVDSKKASTSGR